MILQRIASSKQCSTNHSQLVLSGVVTYFAITSIKGYNIQTIEHNDHASSFLPCDFVGNCSLALIQDCACPMPKESRSR